MVRAWLRTSLVAAGLSALSFIAPACAPAVDVTQALELLDVSTGWHDAGIVNGQNKLVPTVSFKLRNKSAAAVTTLQANVLFHQLNSDEEWGSGFLKIAGSEGLAPGGATDLLTVTSDLGYTGSEPRADMLQNSAFVDARVRILAKSGSNYWQQMGEYRIERRLLVR